MSALVIGYGNPLCGDDGAGPQVVAALAADARFADHDFRAHTQLTPELAVDFAAAEPVVLVDAAVDGAEPGTVRLRRVRSGTAQPPTSHHLSPEVVLGLARALYSGDPPTCLVTVTAADLGPGEQLSRPVRRALPRMTAIVDDLIHALRAPVGSPEFGVDPFGSPSDLEPRGGAHLVSRSTSSLSVDNPSVWPRTRCHRPTSTASSTISPDLAH